MPNQAEYYLVDAKGEGGLVNELDRVAMMDVPALLVGLGGTGIDALVHAKYVLERKLERENGALPGRIAFLGIDTDETVVNKSRVGNARLTKGEFINIFEPKLETFMTNHEAIVQPYLKDWLAEGIPPRVTQYGASGVRQYGRFMLMVNAEKIITTVTARLSAVWNAKKADGVAFGEQEPIHLYVFAGVSGGTGSGTFLDVPYLIKEVIRRSGKETRSYGFMFMPDVNLCKITEPRVRDYVPVNGYAALKELDYHLGYHMGSGG